MTWITLREAYERRGIKPQHSYVLGVDVIIDPLMANGWIMFVDTDKILVNWPESTGQNGSQPAREVDETQ